MSSSEDGHPSEARTALKNVLMSNDLDNMSPEGGSRESVQNPAEKEVNKNPLDEGAVSTGSDFHHGRVHPSTVGGSDDVIVEGRTGLSFSRFALPDVTLESMADHHQPLLDEK